jgi:antitoxin component YwqK of YwqJK toxin-antitoxin module
LPQIWASEKKLEVIKRYTYTASRDDSYNTAQAKAIHEAQVALLQELGVLVEARQKMNTIASGANVRQDFVEELKTYTIGKVQTEIINGTVNFAPNDKGDMVYSATFSMRVDTTDLYRYLDNIVKQKELTEQKNTPQKEKPLPINETKTPLATKQTIDKKKKEYDKQELYHRNGQIKEIRYFKNGQQYGEWKLYYKNGQLQTIGKFKDGKQYGEWKRYYKNGQLQTVEKFKDGKLNGKQKSYHKNGQLQTVGKFKNGKLNGKQESYHKNGQIKKIEYWENGIIKNTSPSPFSKTTN